MANEWVDFKEIKQRVTMEMVLSHYQILGDLKQTPRGFKGQCPIHKGSHGNQFHVDPVKNRWNCFGGCNMEKLEGHVIGFVAAMENVGLREAALRIASWYHIGTERPASRGLKEEAEMEGPRTESVKTVAPSPVVAVPQAPEEEPENKELTFELKKLTADHPYFGKRGIKPDTISHFGLGYCGRGMMKDRIVFPIHRHDGKLIGYTGRTVGEISDENPKWLLPPGLIKPKVLLNFHRVAGQFRKVILVEGGTSLVAVHQAGFPNVIGLLGREILEDEALSYDQFRLITDHFEEAVLLLDGDKDGREAAGRNAAKLVTRMFVRQITLPADLDPSDLPTSDLAQILSFLK